jgi:hypothetical protein
MEFPPNFEVTVNKGNAAILPVMDSSRRRDTSIEVKEDIIVDQIEQQLTFKSLPFSGINHPY